MQIKNVAALALPALVAASPVPQVDVDAAQIVGGTTAGTAEFPFIVSLRQSGSHICGGSLLSANVVLTAGHCCYQQTASSLSIRAGSNSRTSGGIVSQVSKIISNPAFNYGTLQNDVCILTLSTSIPTSSSVSYAKLPAAGTDPAAGTTLTVAGWGTTSSGGSTLPTNLLKVSVPVIARATCAADYGSSQPVTTAMFCAGLTQGGKDSCQGDSGGPIVDASGTQVGVVSWGNGCALAGYPGVYARLSTQLSFINQYA